jgi:hypothetical protein
MHNEIYIVVSNEERWLSTRNVRGRTDFGLHLQPSGYGEPYSGYVKWDKLPLATIENNIRPKKQELLHFATIDTEKHHLTIHKTDGEIIVPRTDTILHFPLHVTGSMFLGSFRFYQTVLDCYMEVVIDYRRYYDIDVKIDSQR